MMRTWLVTLTEHVEKCAVILKNVRKLTGDRPLFRALHFTYSNKHERKSPQSSLLLVWNQLWSGTLAWRDSWWPWADTGEAPPPINPHVSDHSCLYCCYQRNWCSPTHVPKKSEIDHQWYARTFVVYACCACMCACMCVCMCMCECVPCMAPFQQAAPPRGVDWWPSGPHCKLHSKHQTPMIGTYYQATDIQKNTGICTSVCAHTHTQTCIHWNGIQQPHTHTSQASGALYRHLSPLGISSLRKKQETFTSKSSTTAKEALLCIRTQLPGNTTQKAETLHFITDELICSVAESARTDCRIS